MGYLLKEVLKTLCGTNQWSYAVFWKIGYQNPKLLIWEECHYEPSKYSPPSYLFGAEGSELPFGEWEKLWASSETFPSHLESQVGDQVSALISKMMISNQVNIVGEGMVGRAAFTGTHQWHMSNAYATYSNPPEVLNELHNQFSAGMQTVSVIPILPHGVVQLGSSLSISENIGFVNDVRRLILQLGSVPGTLLSDSSQESSVEKIGAPGTSGLLVPVDHPSRAYKMTNTSASMADIYNQRSNFSQASSLPGRIHQSVNKDIQNKCQESSSFPFEGAAMNPFTKSHDSSSQGVVSSWMKLNSAFASQFKDGAVGVEVIPSSSNAGHLASYNARSGLKNNNNNYNNPCGYSHSHAVQGSQMSTEQKILSGSINNHIVSNRSVLNDLSTSQLRENGSLNRHLVTAGPPLLERSHINRGIKKYSEPASVHRSVSNTRAGPDAYLPNASVAGIDFQNSETVKTEVVSCVGGQASVGQMFPLSKEFSGGQCSKDANITRNGMALKEKTMDTDLFQALNIYTDDHSLLNGQFPDFVRDYQDLGKKIACSGTSNDLENQFPQPSSGDDLFDIFGMDLRNKLLGGNKHENTPTYSSLKDLESSLYSESEGMSQSGIFSAMGADNLLDAVVTKARSGAKQISEDNVSCRTTMTKNSNSSVPCSLSAYDHVSLSKNTRGGKSLLSDSFNKAKMAKSSSFKSGCSGEDTGNCSQGTSVYGSQISSWVEQGNHVKHDNSVSAAYSKRPDEVGKSNRKRLKPGENPRPRPKDRQMIQDRVKELREIVPNGSKCSIDALLERTIKHMLFLQSVTKHADKLKNSGESKILNKEGGLLLKDNFEGGATWAFEVGSQSMVCPIIVEDLNNPRQMLVEMLCEERGFFLEIADSIRGMGLTILKGVMEARNDKIWARFAIEANRDVTRMEIFMSLVHLLEQTLKGGSTSSTNSIEHNTLMTPESFAQAAPITATGRPSSLQ